MDLYMVCVQYVEVKNIERIPVQKRNNSTLFFLEVFAHTLQLKPLPKRYNSLN
jgi:hypothetical protein